MDNSSKAVNETTKDNLPESIGRYQITRLIGKGGMGEVYLAFDPVCQREVALKKIRDELLKYRVMRDRFLKEAKIAASLCHPSIISVLEIHFEDNQLYYTMPYVHGETLKSILRETRRREKHGETPHHIGASVNALMRIFLQICEATAYCHARNLLHRDLKPENILIGNYGEVLILDWGLAEQKTLEKDLLEEAMIDPLPQNAALTRPGKVVGTLSYLAPERADGNPADEYSDIYALGVILYQILTLRLPFHRRNLKQYKKIKEYEMLVDALEAAPSREIAPQLSEIAKKCLAFDSKMRYESVSKLIHDIKSYTEGNPKWVFSQSLEKNDPSHWEFQENVLLTKLTPISNTTNVMEWVFLMISKKSFTGNTRITAKVSLDKDSQGIGLLLSIPKPSEREGLEDGYCIWIGGPRDKGIKLIRNNVLLKSVLDVSLDYDTLHDIVIERIDHHIRLFIDDQLVLTYTHYLPYIGSHIGFLYKDTSFILHYLHIYTGSPQILVNCLAIPDAFLSAKDFARAHNEYKRIAESFWGRSEGREALFRSGVSLIEAAKVEKSLPARTKLLQQAEDEFSRLDDSVGSPLEYLGKAMIYQFEQDYEEEIKSLTLALKKFPKHPLVETVEEHIVYRLHESLRSERKPSYGFALLILTDMSHRITNEIFAIILNLVRQFETPLFFSIDPTSLAKEQQIAYLSILIAYWLRKPLVIKSIIETSCTNDSKQDEILENALHALLDLGEYKLVKQVVAENMDTWGYLPVDATDENFQTLFDQYLSPAPIALTSREMNVVFYLLKKGLSRARSKILLSCFAKLEGHEIPDQYKRPYNILQLKTFLLAKDMNRAEECISHFDTKEIMDPKNPLFLLYGCYLAHTKGYQVALHHFKVMKETSYPPISALLAYFLSGYIDFKSVWAKHATVFEEEALLEQIILFYDLSGKKARATYYERKLKSKR